MQVISEQIQGLQQEIESLRAKLRELGAAEGSNYYYTEAAQQDWHNLREIPEQGLGRGAARLVIENAHALDFDHKLNTSSYVNVSFEKEEEEIALMGLRVNLADQTVYPHSYKLHDTVVNMLARLWNCPEPDDFSEFGVYPGAGTVGSTEACLLAGLALKFRWRNWYARSRQCTVEQIMGVRPNLVISTCFQAAWEKLFKYMDIEPRLLSPSVNSFKLDPEQVRDAVDEHTIGVVCIMGNHYGGQYDPVSDINDMVEEVNKEKGYQVGIHVDAASGSFIAPFQQGLPPWDFRLTNVLSISASGHKYGQSCCGTGWVIWRQREDLSDHVGISVSYLGGQALSYTLNFSRPASGVYTQYYKLLHYGMSGYQQANDNMMSNARYLRDGLRAMTYQGKPRFELLDDGDEHCLPVVTARLNPECGFSYDDVDWQHGMSQHHWYVGSYRMQFNHPLSEQPLPLFHDADADASMFRIVVKTNLTRNMAEHLLDSFHATADFFDSVSFSKLPEFEMHHLRHKDQRTLSNHC